MTDNVSILPIVTGEPHDPDLFLSKAIGNLESTVILGYDKDREFFFSSSLGDGPEVLWLLEVAKHQLIEVCHD